MDFMEANKCKRYGNFELIRIIAMCFVVISHYHWGVHFALGSKTPSACFLSMFFHTTGAIGVVLFVLLTGYFMIDKNINVKHIFKIVLETVFYSYIILAVLALFFHDYVVFKPIMVYKSLFPVTTGQYWFVTAYIVLYLSIPMLNKLFYVLDKKELKKYLFLFMFIWFVIPLFGYNTNMQGNGFTGFICLYYIGAYIKKYGIAFFENKRNAVLTILVSQSAVCLYLLAVLNAKLFEDCYVMHMTFRNSVISALTGLSVFMLIKNIKINYNPVIDFFSSSAFAVYLITENIFVRDIIWTKIFRCNDSPYLFYMIFNMALALAVSYTICAIIDKIRMKTAEQYLINIATKIYNAIYKVLIKLI